jgi:hypothetical protein
LFTTLNLIGDHVMATDKPTATPATSTGERDPFDAVELRFASLRYRLEVLKAVLGCENVPNELAAAAYVFNETVTELGRWHAELDDWHRAHEHTQKAPKEVQS